MAHKLAEPYSGKNPVPQIATKLTALVNPEKATEAKAQQLQDQSGQREENLTKKRASQLKNGHAMRVEDPTTGEEMDIKNAADEPDTRGENVLNMDFPPPDWNEHKARVIVVADHTIVLVASAYLGCFIVAYFISRSIYSFATATILPTLLAYTLLFRLRNISRNDFEDRAWHSERTRGLRAGSDVDEDGKISDQERIKESAEWANAVLRGVWPIMNPDLFSSLLDLLEDIMQASAPSFVHSVRIADMGLGNNAARITSIRSLPDDELRQTLRAKAGKDPNSSSNEQANPDTKESEGGEGVSHVKTSQQEELSGDHVNLEVSFAYHGLPTGKTAESKAGNLHILVEFSVGLRGVYGVRVPAWVEITGAVGTARARLQLISDPPFVKTTMVSLMGLPHITISVVALAKVLPNVMNIPFISGFISNAINTAVAEYVAPKSLTIDLQQLISGDDIKKETETIGILVVHIHRATDVKGMDMDGASADPYITLTYSKLGKPLYSTRIIKGDRNPVYEETAFLMVDVNTIRLREKLSFQLWDSDRTSVDDMLGIAEIDIVELVRNRANPVRRISKLSSPDLNKRPGSVEYTVGYYGKLPPTNHLKTDGSDPGIPEDLRNKPEFKEARAKALNDLEAAVLVTPPDPEWPSGILSIQVHEIKDLNVKKENRHTWWDTGVKEGDKGQDDTGQPQEEGEGLPSSYCEISLNDELVYKTRVKPITSFPMFNAGTERFVKNWRSSHVLVVVKDSRMRENDAILGIVMLKLSELFVNASQLTRFYSLEEGLGHGRIRISVLFRPVEAKLPLNLLGFDIGSLEIRDVIVKPDSSVAQELAKCSLKLKVSKSDSSSKISLKAASKNEEGALVWHPDEAMPIPVRQRYGSALFLTFKNTSAIVSSSEKALGVLWLRNITDNKEGKVEIALWRATDDAYSRLKLNYIPPDGNLECWDTDKEKLHRIGTIILDTVFKPGVSEHHGRMLGGGRMQQKEAWDAFNRERAGGLRESVGVMEEGDDHVKAQGEPGLDAPNAEARQPDDDATMAPANIHDGDMTAAKTRSDEDINTTVQTEDAQDVERVSTNSGHGDEDKGSDADGGEQGLVQKFKKWKKNEKELHRDHRGMMQMKPVRTAEWLKDNVEEGAHAIKERFSMRTRKPDVETEV